MTDVRVRVCFSLYMCTHRYLEKGRYEAKDEQYDTAEELYKQAVDLCEAVYGKGSAESGTGRHTHTRTHTQARTQTHT